MVHRALIDHRLPVVLAGRLQRINVEQPVGGRVEADVPQLRLDGRVLDGQPARLHQTRIAESAPLGQVEKVVPVQGPGQAFPVEHRVGGQRRRYPAVGVHVGEIELAAGLEQPFHIADYLGLVGAQVDHAVGHHDIEVAVLQIKLVQLFDIAFQETHIAARVAEFPAVVLLMASRHGELFVGHVHADHLAAVAHQGREHVDVPAGATAQVQNAHALQRRRSHQAAAVVTGYHLVMQARQQRLQVLRRRLIAAGVGLQVVAAGKLLAVVILNLFTHG